jgi:phosphoribosylanthranilate isomerase
MMAVKICGLMNGEDIEFCVRAGARYLGFVVDYPAAVPWNLNRMEALQLIKQVPPPVKTVVVTGGEIGKILAVAEALKPDMIQLHHEETLAQVEELAVRLNHMGIRAIKALCIGMDGKCLFEIPDPAAAARALNETLVSALLVDAHRASMPGGTGITVDLSIFKTVQKESELPVFLAGGLKPANVRSIIRKANPYAIDVLSGVEARPGKKDFQKVRQFMQSVADSTD